MAGVVFSAYQTPPIVWATTIITMAVVGGSYFIKNYWVPSNSPQGTLSFVDALCGLTLAILAGIGNSISSLVVSGIVVWSLLLKTIITVGGTYLGATYFSGSTPQDSQPPILKDSQPPILK